MSMSYWKLINYLQRSSLMPSKIRMLILSLFGCKVSSTAVVSENVYIGSNKMVFSRGVFVNTGVFLDGSAEIFLGELVRIGPYVKILTGSHEYKNNVYRRDPTEKTISKNVRIERGCWIGIGSIVMPGVVIQEGCVIGAGSVVVKDTKPNGLYLGNPAKRIKDLPIE